MIYLGIDPGKSGGMAWLRANMEFPPVTMKTDGVTEKDIQDAVARLSSEACRQYCGVSAVIEKVSSSPQMGVKSSFTFGDNFGFWRGILTGAGIPYVLVSPQKWQKAMGCLSGGDKNKTKAAAQRLYPNEKITHSVADALLLATYCRRHHAELF